MKKLLTTICLMFTPLFASGGTAFEDDPTNYFVSGSGANEALSMVNEIICFLKNTRSERYVNDGYYKATVYVDDCSTVSAASSSADGAIFEKLRTPPVRALRPRFRHCCHLPGPASPMLHLALCSLSL